MKKEYEKHDKVIAIDERVKISQIEILSCFWNKYKNKIDQAGINPVR